MVSVPWLTEFWGDIGGYGMSGYSYCSSRDGAAGRVGHVAPRRGLSAAGVVDGAVVVVAVGPVPAAARGWVDQGRDGGCPRGSVGMRGVAGPVRWLSVG